MFEQFIHLSLDIVNGFKDNILPIFAKLNETFTIDGTTYSLASLLFGIGLISVLVTKAILAFIK